MRALLKILVCGGRDFEDKHVFAKHLDLLNPTHLISGGARGADTLSELYSKSRQIKCVVVPADWDKHGKSAGFIRNQEMIDMKPDLVVAFWDGVSNGTKDTISRAKRRKINTLIIYY